MGPSELFPFAIATLPSLKCFFISQNGYVFLETDTVQKIWRIWERADVRSHLPSRALRNCPGWRRAGILGKRLLSAVPRITSIWMVLLAGLSGCQKSTSQKASVTPPVPVEVVAAEIRAMPIEMQAIGTVEPIASVQLKSKVQGEILRVRFADGSEVQAGDPLFEIDARPFDVAFRRAQANLATARSAAVNANEQAEHTPR